METILDSSSRRSAIWSTGLAMFSMFFGAGNVVFPLALGRFAQDKTFFGMVGLMITAIFVPLAGLLSMLLFNGNYTAYFRRIGKVPGAIITVFILALIGPFAGLPRCMTISYSTLTAFGLEGLPGVNLMTFSLFSCVVIFFFAFRPNRLLTLLGYVLTPILLISLGTIIVKGIFTVPEASVSQHTTGQVFSQGLLDGYNTMDLLAAFFFSFVVLLSLRKGHHAEDFSLAQNRSLLSITVTASLIAASLLTVIYFFFSYLAAGYSASLDVPDHEMLGALAFKVLGPYAGMLASVAVCFACLTTEIALTSVFAEFLHETVFKEKHPFVFSLLLTLAVAFGVSTLNFSGISAFVVPILQFCYPALIVLVVLNILHKLYDFKQVKSFFYATIGLTLLARLIS